MSVQDKAAATQDFASLQSVLKLSFWGWGAWRAYRAGVNPALIGELYGTAESYEEYVTRLTSTMRTIFGGDRLPTLTALDEFITANVGYLSATHQTIFWIERNRYRSKLAEIFKVDNDDPRLISVVNLMLSMFDGAYLIEENAGYTTAVAQVWFDLLDLAADTQSLSA